MRFAVAGRTALTAGVASDVAFQLWNPDVDLRLRLREFHVFQTVGTASNVTMGRTLARGTPATSVTPDADNAFDRLSLPASGAILDTSFSAQPTISGDVQGRFTLPGANADFGWYWPDEPYSIPPGSGLGFWVPATVAIQALDVYVVWEE